MSPALTLQAEAFGSFLYFKGRAIQVTLAKCTSNFQFLTDGKGFLRTHNLQFPDTSALTSLQRNQVDNIAEVLLQFLIDNACQFLTGILHCPFIEVIGLHVIVVKHLRKHGFVMSITERILD